MKKILAVLGTLLVLVLAAIVVIPMVVDVDQYRPKILEAANSKLNGKLELGKLKLSLWGTIHVGIDGMTLTDLSGTKVVAVKDAFLSISWTSIFGGSPLLTFNLNEPAIRVVKDEKGKLNVLALIKETGRPETGTATNPTGNPAGNGGAAVKLPAVVSNARLGVDVRNALFSYRDEAAKSETTMKDLNLRVKDLSLSRTTEIEVSGLFQSAAGTFLRVEGPFAVLLHASPRVEGGEFQGMTADLDANFDDVEIRAGQAFSKKKGVAARAAGAIELSKDRLSISKLSAKFFNAEIDLSGKVENLRSDPTVDLTVKSNPIALGPWNELVPALKDYSLSGEASFDAEANGPASKLRYSADFSIRDLKAKSAILKAEPVVNVVVKVATDRIEKLSATMKAPGNDLSIDGTVTSFEKPKIEVKIASSSLDLDRLIDVGEPAKGVSAGAGNGSGTASGATGKQPAADFDSMLDPLRKNEVARSTTLFASANLKLIQFMGAKMTDVSAKVSMRDLKLAVDSLNLKLFGGSAGMKASVALAPKVPTYSFSASVSNLDLRKAVQSRMEAFKDTVLGQASFKISGSGSSLNPESAKKNLSAKGSMRVNDAEFASIDVAKMATDAINKALEKVGDKIPGAKGKTIKSLPEKASRYEYIASDFSISNGRFVAPNFTAKAAKDRGLDLRGSTEVGLIDQELKADWEIIDTYNLTHARDLGFDVSGIHVPSALAEGSNPVVIPVSVACKYTAPCPSYGKVPEHFVKVALENTKRGAVNAVKSKAEDRAKEVGKKLLKGLFH